MMTKIPEVLKSGSGKRWVWITGVVAIFALLFAIAWNIECERAVAPQELPGEARSFIGTALSGRESRFGNQDARRTCSYV